MLDIYFSFAFSSIILVVILYHDIYTFKTNGKIAISYLHFVRAMNE